MYSSSYLWCSSNKIFLKSSTLRNIHRKTSVLESFFDKVTGLQACNCTKKRLQHSHFPGNIANFKNTYFEKHMPTAASDSSYILHRKLNKIIQDLDWPFFLLKHKITQSITYWQKTSIYSTAI